LIRAVPALAVAALASACAPGQVPPPHGVNGAVIGTAAENMTAGPARICFIMTGFDLRADERSYLDYLGIHWAAIRVVGPHSEFVIKEGNIWREPTQRGRAIADAHGRRIVRYEHWGRVRYLIYGEVDGGTPGEDRPLIWMEGSALRGTEADRLILDRIVRLPEHETLCNHRYLYGMNFE
jgi:hypothetical protein